MGNLNKNQVQSLYLHFALQTEVHGSENYTGYETYTEQKFSLVLCVLYIQKVPY